MSANVRSHPITKSLNPVVSVSILSLVRGTETELLEEIMPLVQRQSLWLDLSRVERIDAAGLAALIALYRAAREAGRCFGVTNPTPHAKEILCLVGLDKFLLNEDSEEGVCPEPETAQNAA